ncbi:hypothetical protein CERSUDRAFT_90342 [Gelatoporia subvermispora B]|uniref:Uncharacterized protein n=1 Tax=Ceriporiopsis subvermispora (strain B) TaxID=914234 RepID=M2RS66_CERS8|nr:hypothetical protein CERSUDRAFT_90342 [Gelatoporia subvermispora B]
MASDSETEPESDAGELDPGTTDFATQLTQRELSPAAEHGIDLGIVARNAQDAMESLVGLDLKDIETDDTHYQTIENNSRAILAFLDNVVSHDSGSISGVQAIQAAICALLDGSFMSLLFDYRRIFHIIAAKAMSPGSTSSLVVCWADVVLVKLSEAIVAIARGGDELPREPEFITLRRHKEDDLLRAAIQLPEHWRDVATVVSSDYASPGAKRLALCVLYGVYVLGPDLGTTPWVYALSAAELLRCLQLHVEQVSATCEENGAAEVTDETKISWAMAIALFAAADLETINVSARAYRPHTDASLLRLLRAIMHCGHPTRLAQPSMEPFSALNGAQHIVVDASHVTLWSWYVWDDVRLEGFQTVEKVTINWLHNRGTFSDSMNPQDLMDRWEEGLAPDLLRSSQSATVILQIITRVCSMLAVTPKTASGQEPLPLLYKCIWAASCHLSSKELDMRSEVDIGHGLCKLYVLLQNSKVELDMKDLIILALASLDTATLKGVMQTLFSDSQVAFISRTEESIRRLQTSVSDVKMRRLLSYGDHRNIRQLLQIITLFSHHEIIDCFSGDLICLFVRSLICWLSATPSNAACIRTVRDALILCIAVVDLSSLSPNARNSSSSKWHEPLLQLISQSHRADLFVATNFAAYFVLKCPSTNISSATTVEAWAYLSDVLMMIISRQFVDAAEPLALLVCENICYALNVLLKYSTENAIQACLSSPWTARMCVDLRSIISRRNVRIDPYFKILDDNLLYSARSFIQSVNYAVGATEDPSPNVPEIRELSELTAFYIGGFPRLMPRFARE